MTFTQRLIRNNARWLVGELRRIADVLEVAAPGPPQLSIMLFISEGSIRMGEITVEDTAAPLSATVTFKDEHGHDTQPDETPEWTSSDESVASVTASEDGLTATVTVANPGATVIECAAGDIVAQGTVTVQPGDAVIGDVSFSQGGGEQPPA